jgi:hypothetical protein
MLHCYSDALETSQPVVATWIYLGIVIILMKVTKLPKCISSHLFVFMYYIVFHSIDIIYTFWHKYHTMKHSLIRYSRMLQVVKSDV